MQWLSTREHLGVVSLSFRTLRTLYCLEDDKSDGSITYGIWVINKVYLHWSVGSCGKQIGLLLFINTYQGHT